MASPLSGLTLSGLIKNAANEIRAARAESLEDAVMQFEGCELELAVTIGADAGGGIKFWLVDASAKVKAETVSKVKLKFGPNPANPIAAMAIAHGDKGPAATRAGRK